MLSYWWHLGFGQIKILNTNKKPVWPAFHVELAPRSDRQHDESPFCFLAVSGAHLKSLPTANHKAVLKFDNPPS
jgi:hypothetical protein